MNNKVICRYCNAESVQSMNTSFFGFKNFTCLSCGKANMFPLSKTYKVMYWIIVTFLVISSVGQLFEGKIGLVSVLGIAGIASLYMNYKYEKEVKSLSIK